MSLVPIFFKADDANNEKKGNVRGQDLGAILSLLTSKKVGILDVLKTGTNPCTYSNIDNSVPGQVTITFNAGYISIFGRLIYIEDGTNFTFSIPASGNGYLCVRVDLSSVGASECEMVLIPASSGLVTNDIVENPVTGIYEFRLYDYSSTGTQITLSNPTNERIVWLEDYLKGDNFTTQNSEDKSKKIATTEFVQNLVGLNNSSLSPNKTSIKLANGLIIKWGFARTPSGTILEATCKFDTTHPFKELLSINTTFYYKAQTNANVAYSKLLDANKDGFTYSVQIDRVDCYYIAIGI